MSDAALSAGVVKSTNCISTDMLVPNNECSGYDTKPSDCEVLDLELSLMRSSTSL